MFDCLITGGSVIDGTGAERRRADVAIQNGRIAAIGRPGGKARRSLDASGAIVAPGFVDIHTRHDLPAGAARLYAEAEGIEHVLVNGVEVVTGHEITDARPGTILRSGRDTDSVEVPGGRD